MIIISRIRVVVQTKEDWAKSRREKGDYDWGEGKSLLEGRRENKQNK